MLALAAVVTFSHMIFQVNLTSLLITRYPDHAVAIAFSVVAGGSGMGGILSTQVVGYLVSTTCYSALFVIMARMHPIAGALVWWAVRSTRDPAAVTGASTV